MSNNYSKAEQETIILFDEEGEEARVYTYNKRLKKRLSLFSQLYADCYLVNEEEGAVEYYVPKSWICINKPRQLSEEQRQKMAMRAKENFKTKEG